MIGQLTMQHYLCQMVADGLALFAAQEKPFHEWRLSGDDRTDASLLGLFFVLNNYDAKSHMLALYDVEPGGCVRGMPTHYYQKEEMLAALVASLECGGNAGSPELLFEVVRSVLRAPLLEKLLKEYFDAAIAEVTRVGKIHDRTLSHCNLGKFKDALEEQTKTWTKSAIRDLETPSNYYLITDTFMRRLYIECNDKRDAPGGFRIRAGLAGMT